MFSQTKSHKGNLFFAFLAAGLVLALDQATKVLSQSSVVLNTGVSFSWQSGAGETLTFLLTAGFLVLVAFASWQLLQPQPKTVAVGYGLLLGGGFSNLLDRWIFGGVRDIWPVPFLSLTNNLADWAIFLAVLLLVLGEIIPMYKHLWNRS